MRRLRRRRAASKLAKVLVLPTTKVRLDAAVDQLTSIALEITGGAHYLDEPTRPPAPTSRLAELRASFEAAVAELGCPGWERYRNEAGTYFGCGQHRHVEQLLKEMTARAALPTTPAQVIRVDFRAGRRTA